MNADVLDSAVNGAQFPPVMIGTVKIDPGLVLAPMSGVTALPFRQLIKALNGPSVGLLVSEFVSVEGMTRGSEKTLRMMAFAPEERPYAIQIFGHDIDRMRDAAQMVQDFGADIVDINCGCPAPKVVKRGGGCELMRQPDHLAKILRAVRSAVSIPVTLKMRSGWDEQTKNSLDIAKIAESEGLNALTVHGRTRSQLYRGQADWSIVEEVAEAVKIPVFGSGDVVCHTSALARRKGKIAGLYIGRGALENPFVFRDLVRGQTTDLRRNQGLVLDVVERYTEMLRAHFRVETCPGRLKQLVSQMARGHEWRKALVRSNTLAEQCEIIAAVRRAGALDEPAGCSNFASA